MADLDPVLYAVGASDATERDAVMRRRLTDAAYRATGAVWETWSTGLDVKVLVRDRDEKPEAFLMRMQPRAVVPAHAHDRSEGCLVIHGDLIYQGHTLGAGDFTVARTGGMHAEMVSPSGGLLYVRYLEDASD